MKIEEGDPKHLKRRTGKVTVWKKTNYWLFCPFCEVLVYFRIFKARYDLSLPCVHGACGAELIDPTPELRKSATFIVPHFRIGTAPKSNWYHDTYLASGTWKVIRQRVLDRDNHTCARCSKPAECVHHKSYDAAVLAGERDGDLVSLCIPCHGFIEFDGKRKTSLIESNQRLNIAP